MRKDRTCTSGQVHVRIVPYKAILQALCLSFADQPIYLLWNVPWIRENRDLKTGLNFLLFLEITSKRIKANWIHVCNSNMPMKNLLIFNQCTLQWTLTIIYELSLYWALVTIDTENFYGIEISGLELRRKYWVVSMGGKLILFIIHFCFNFPAPFLLFAARISKYYRVPRRSLLHWQKVCFRSYLFKKIFANIKKLSNLSARLKQVLR